MFRLISATNGTFSVERAPYITNNYFHAKLWIAYFVGQIENKGWLAT